MAESGRGPLIIAFIVGLTIGLALFFGLYFGLPRDCPDDKDDSGSDEVVVRDNYATYKTAAVASDAGRCSEIGAKKLQKGGSVVDAAIATMVCGGLYNPQSAGIGGGSFISLYNAPTKEMIFIDSRETAPLASDENMYGGNGFISQIGSLAIAVPGEVAGYWAAHQQYGVLPWAELFEESIELANNGIVVSKALERDIKKEEQYIKNATFNLSPYFMNPDGTLKKEGDTVVRPAFAQTLRAIADEGYMGFYNGTLGRRIIADIEDAVEDGIITFEDLQQYKVEIKSLINVTVGDFTLFTPGTPSSGAVLALIFNILKGYNFTPDDMSDTASSTLSYHRITEAFKFAFAHRSELGDERFNDNVTALVANMTSADYGESIRLKIDDTTTKNSTFYGGDFQQVEDSGTSHISVIGADGSAVSATSTINTRFGSKVVGIRTGIIFNNEMDDFSSPNVTNYFGLPPSPNNFIKPGKRPMSSMVPSILLKNGNERPTLVVGASGGTKIITGTALTTLLSTWFGKSIEDATAEKRIHHQLYPEYLGYEVDPEDGDKQFDAKILEGLRALNHQTEPFNSPGSVVQAVQSLKDDDVMTAVSDKRKGGYPDGY